MPELPGKAAKLTRHVAVGRTIEKVETYEDTIVYSGGITHSEFAKEITGRKVMRVGRYGKVFYIELDGKGRMPVLHLGMTGMIQFIMHFSATDTLPATELAFIDARRLGRIRLAREPTKEPPISELGFDPILSMPEYEEFSKMVLKRTCPIKALLLDQSFSAGVGNWVAGAFDQRGAMSGADEILYQSRIHPEQRASNLSEEQIKAVYKWAKVVCKTAVEVDADSSRFPADWLFKYRWAKGQKSAEEMLLPSGEKAKIEWITVGGRTSAVVTQLQKMPTGGRTIPKKVAGANSNGEAESGPSKPAPAKGRKRKAGGKQDGTSTAENYGGGDPDELDLTQIEVETRAGTSVVRRSSGAAYVVAAVTPYADA
ncbi:hypothetical protein FRC10_000044 [Ceratobasidium sp. 414]|nr:hypothetical protein FRC10_000044 [Ceratobasidium sp. 414]